MSKLGSSGLQAGEHVTRRGEKILRPVWPNVGIEVDYRRHLYALIRQMQASYLYWLRAQYRQTPPQMAQDATPATELQRELKKLGVRWEKQFAEAAPKLAAYFAKSAANRSDAVLRKILKDGGWTVRFQMTASMRDILDATIANNVSLIKSIATEYHTQVEGLVMRSVTAGRDLSFLTDELEKRYGVTRRRAALIARTQNNMATASMQRVRQIEAGIQSAIWMHSHAGKDPRKTHLRNDGKRYNIETGWFDPDPKVRRHIWPSELINCRCQSKPIVKGFS
jgi:SPP1 gp7 family putative phage head morphogenesis protein